MLDDRTLAGGTLAAAVILVAAAACGGGSSPPPNSAAAPAGNVAMSPGAMNTGAPPPGYPGAAPPGYPGTAPPGYPAQPAYAPPAGYGQPPPPAAAAYPPAAPGPMAPGTAPATGSPPPVASASPGPLAPTDPNSLQGILAGIQGALQGTLVPGGAAAADVTEAGLKLYATRAAPGMQPDGNELKQTLSEGQHAVVMLTLQAGKCYTVLGFSPPGSVKDLDLNLLAPPFYMTLAGQDLSHNNTPTIGASPNPMCPIIPFPLQYKLDVFAKSGSGPVAVQLYSKSKS